MPGWPAGAYHPGISSDTPQKAAILHLNAFRSHRVAEILLRLGICAQRFAIGLVRCKAIELDHRKGKVVWPLLWQEVSEQRATASCDDRRPGCRVTFEVCDPMRIERVAYAAR